MKQIIIGLGLLISMVVSAQNFEWREARDKSIIKQPTVYQWSVPLTDIISSETNDHPRAFLWIPENCQQVKAVILGQHNMSEEDLFERAQFRKGLTNLDIAQVWISPAFDMTFDFNKGAGETINKVMNELAVVSGYTELTNTAIIPIGHSACASFPWNFAAWNPTRTLAAISLHGDAPLTNLTGNGQPSPDWENRTIEGVPGLMIEGEYEWWEDRVQPALDYRAKFPQAPVSFLCDAGNGHFNVSEELVEYILLFIKKAVKYRLTQEQLMDENPVLNPVNPQDGWLKERWKKDTLPSVKAAPFNKYTGDIKDAFWYFDKQIAIATELYYQRSRGKKERNIGFTQHGSLMSFNKKHHAQYVAELKPQLDGLTFSFNAVFTDSLRKKEIKTCTNKLKVSKICGSVEQLNDTTFKVSFFRMGMNNTKRTSDIWLLASHPGNKEYKSSVQQFYMRIPLRNKEGLKQEITFAQPDRVINLSALADREIELNATATSGMPVSYYVKEGPAIIEGDKLKITEIPPRAKLPIKVTVVAWQYGRNTAPKVQSAEPIERTFFLQKDNKF